MKGNILNETESVPQRSEVLSLEMDKLEQELDKLGQELDEALNCDNWERVRQILKDTGIVFGQMKGLVSECAIEAKATVECLKRLAAKL